MTLGRDTEALSAIPRANSASLQGLWPSGRPEPGTAGAELPPAAPPSSADGPRSCSRVLRGNPGLITPFSSCSRSFPVPAASRPGAPALLPQPLQAPLLRGRCYGPTSGPALRMRGAARTHHVTRGIWRRPWSGVRGAERSLLGVCRCHVAAYREESPEWGEAAVR